MDDRSRIPAKLDYWQSVTGLILGIFIVFHMIFEASILVSNDLMEQIAHFFELRFLVEGGVPLAVSALGAFIFTVFIIHALLAIRKFPNRYVEYEIYKKHSDAMKHSDTSLWLTQVITGFIMFFIGSVHLYYVMMNPTSIGPIMSGNRMTDDMFAPLYIILLVSVILHAFAGLYRLAVKWIPMSKETRQNLIKIRNMSTVVFILLGLASIFRYIQIGLQN